MKKFVLIVKFFFILASCDAKYLYLNDGHFIEDNHYQQKNDKIFVNEPLSLQVNPLKSDDESRENKIPSKPSSQIVNKLDTEEKSTNTNKTLTEDQNQVPKEASSVETVHEDQDTKQPFDNNTNEEFLFLDIFVNKEKRGEVIQLVHEKNRLWISKNFISSLQLQNFSNMKENRFFDEEYIEVPLNYNPKIDMEKFSLDLTIPPEDMKVQNPDSVDKILEKTDSIFSFIWNYILGFYHNVSNSKASLNSHHRTILTTPKGYLSNSLKVDKDFAQPLKAVRLETSYTIDLPKSELLFTLGDFASDAPNWSSLVASAGIKIQKSSIFNQGTLTYPTVDLIPALERQGVAEIMLNNGNFFKKDLPMGRFLLDDIKLPPGSHEGELIVRDENGIVSKVPFSYFADKDMLKPGLQQFSYNLGFLRKNYLNQSFSYGGPFFAANHKVGITDFMTLGLHGQLSHEVRLASLEPRFRLGSFGSTSIPLALSLRDEKNGYGVGNETNINFADFSLRLKNMYFSPGYKPQNSQIKNNLSGVFLSSTSARYSKGFLRYTSLHYQLYKSSSNTNSVLSLNQAFPIFQNVNIYANANYNFSQNAFSCFAVLNIGFAKRHSVGVIVDESTNHDITTLKTTATYRYHSDPTKDNRYFASTSVGYGQALSSEGVLGFNNKILEGTIGAKADSNKNFGYSATLGSALVVAKNKLFLSRPIENSFSILRVPNRAGLKVYRDGGLFLGQTQEDGYLLINDLNPYQKSIISFDTKEIDPSIDISDLEKDIVIYPGIKTAHEIALNAKTIRHFLIKPKKDGKNFDFGSSFLANGKEVFVGHDGDLYIEMEDNVTLINGTNKNNSCSFNVYLPQIIKDEYVVNLGDVLCD